MSRRRFLVTAALPYANYRPHLGHLAGAYLPADIYVRYLRMVGDDVVFVCGSDDHGVPITLSAREEGISPAELVSKYREAQRRAFAGVRIEFDVYSGTSVCPHHVEMSQEFFRRIHDRGHINDHETEQYYCSSCDQFLPDRYVEGTCPVCGAGGARGDQCDACGNSFEQTRLTDAHCAICRATPELRRVRHWFFKLNEYRAPLEEWLEAREGWRDNVRNFALGILREPLPERSITRDLRWGVPVPLEEAAGKVLYVWFDAPIGYISFTRELFEQRGDPDGWKRYWQDPDSRIVHFIGKDNIIFHAVIWPAMLMAHGDYTLPHNVPSNEFLQLDEQKFSKSKKHGVWVEDMLEEFDGERIRYYLTAIAPETRDSSFTIDEFVKSNNDALSDVFGNLCHRVFTFTDRYCDGQVPAAPRDSVADDALLAAVARHRNRWREALEGVHLREAQSIALDLARGGNRFFDAAQPWKTRNSDMPRCAGTLRACLELVAALGVLFAPFLPATAQKLRAAFGADGDVTRADLDALGSWRLTEGASITPPGVLFPKLEAESHPG